MRAPTNFDAATSPMPMPRCRVDGVREGSSMRPTPRPAQAPSVRGRVDQRTPSPRRVNDARVISRVAMLLTEKTEKYTVRT